MSPKYQVLPPTAPVPAPDDYLERLVREGAQKALQAAVEQEVDEFLGRLRYERSAEFRGHRNGHLPARQIGVGMSNVGVRVPRVRDVPAEVSPEGYHSQIVNRYERRSRTQARLLVRLYLEGLSTGDFEPVFRALVGETAALSQQSILRLKEEWKQEFEVWRRRPLKRRYPYLFADGFYVKAGQEREKTAILVVLGVDEHGQKELLAMEEGYRESKQSWAAVMRSLQERGLAEDPLLLVGDGALGIWAALAEVFPSTRRGRCWNHLRLNVVDKLPRRLQAEAQGRLRELYEAPSRAECERLRDDLCAYWRRIGQLPAAECLERDGADFLTFYDFPQEHWIHLRTSNAIESIFAGVRLRSNGAKRVQVRESALYLTFKLILRLGLNWRAFNAPNQLQLLLQGHQFRDGKLVVEAPVAVAEASA